MDTPASRSMYEYQVQVLCVPELMGRQMAEHSAEVAVLAERVEREMAAGAPGIAGIYRQRLKWALNQELEKLADNWFTDFYARVKCYCDDIKVEKTKKATGGSVLLLNTSCLVPPENSGNLGEELRKINNANGLIVRFSGPWPPFGSVTEPAYTVTEGKYLPDG